MLYIELEEQLVLTKVIRQNTCVMVVGSDLRGLAVSVAARPSNAVPAKEKAAVTNTEQRPLKPSTKAPGFFQYLPPMYSPCGPPPQLRTMPRMLFGKAVSV